MIIAFTGEKGSGKNYVGDYVAEHFNVPSVAFADPVKLRVMDTYQLQSVEEYDEFKRSSFNIMGREIHGRVMTLGIGMGMRYVNPKFPLEYIQRQIDYDQQKSKLQLVITDLRFDNEMDFLRSVESTADVTGFGNIVVKIVSSNPKTVDHISERGFPDAACDLILYNSGSPSFREESLEKIKELVKYKQMILS